MQSLLTNRTASLTELRDPAKVLTSAGSKPIAIMNRNKCVAYIVPTEAIDNVEFEPASKADVMAMIKKRKEFNQPVLDYLRDK